MVLLTVNILLGLMLSARYNPVRQWPHRRLPIFDIHNWTAYIALGLVLLHPAILLFSRTAGFGIGDILLPVQSPKADVVQLLRSRGILLRDICCGHLVLPQPLGQPSLEKAPLCFLCRSRLSVHPWHSHRSGAEERASRPSGWRKGSRRKLCLADCDCDHLADPLSTQEAPPRGIRQKNRLRTGVSEPEIRQRLAGKIQDGCEFCLTIRRRRFRDRPRHL